MNCEQIFRSHVLNGRIIEHTERVVAMCKFFSDRMNLSEKDKKILTDSAWLHDIAKTQYGEAHNIPENIKSVLGDVSLPSDIYDVILNHKDGFTPANELVMVCSILRICDKLDKFNKKSWDAEEKFKSSVILIKNHIEHEKFEHFKTICDEIYFTKLE